MSTVPLGFNIDAPRWDQSTFVGRLKHFLNITDPRTVLVPEEELDRAKALVEGCRAGLVPPGSSQEQLLYAKKLYDSAFHPDSGEKMNLIGRMSFQVPGGMAITGFMLQFYRTVPAVVFWQWVNQSFNAFVNYTNRNAASPISLRQIGVAYVTATGAALATAVGLNLYTKRAPPLLARWVPFAAVAAANCINIPMMRQQEIINGITVTDGDNNELGRSRRAAVKGITQVVVSRITMAAPGMSECKAGGCGTGPWTPLGPTTLPSPASVSPMKKREGGTASQVSFGLIPQMELISLSCHSSRSPSSPQASSSQPTACGGHGVLSWQLGPTRTHLMLSGPSPSLSSPASPHLMRPLTCRRPSRRDWEHEEHGPCCLGDGSVWVNILAVSKHPVALSTTSCCHGLQVDSAAGRALQAGLQEEPDLFSLYLVILPIIMERLEKFTFMQRIRVLHGPLQVLLCGGFLLFMVPAACALFPQRWYLSHSFPLLHETSGDFPLP
ncbi:sideroflexin-2 isoform X2 [Manacus vitellinus]|uniref:sideroflexin-2 isoform X2 n=1 Tax=Manacus vitellinus TaxID=328815 RepID=UPI000846D130|nr:sideroflexin-2 isoform X2 [Manacus vitellinus]